MYHKSCTNHSPHLQYIQHRSYKSFNVKEIIQHIENNEKTVRDL